MSARATRHSQRQAAITLASNQTADVPQAVQPSKLRKSSGKQQRSIDGATEKHTSASMTAEPETPQAADQQNPMSVKTGLPSIRKRANSSAPVGGPAKLMKSTTGES
ncbi:hypothetical protein BD414DRAFT_88218 [Trametes punicea]|nr:hypothetical protein BD414DRAFT_88218 [Trametes punicea]